MDEVIEVFKPERYVHMGHDEVYEIDVCPICKHKDPAKLFADDVNKLHAYLKSRGLKMMIWSDMIQPVTKYRTPAAIDMIPKDGVSYEITLVARGDNRYLQSDPYSLGEWRWHEGGWTAPNEK